MTYKLHKRELTAPFISPARRHFHCPLSRSITREHVGSHRWIALSQRYCSATFVRTIAHFAGDKGDIGRGGGSVGGGGHVEGPVQMLLMYRVMSIAGYTQPRKGVCAPRETALLYLYLFGY